MIKSIKAWAVIDTKDPKLRVRDIYGDKDLKLLRGEKLIRVEIHETFRKRSNKRQGRK